LKIEFKESFLKDVQALADGALKKRIRKVLAEVEQAGGLTEVKNLKKLKGGDHYYRIRVGDYRLGFVLQGDVVVFVRCLHRKDIYRYLP